MAFFSDMLSVAGNIVDALSFGILGATYEYFVPGPDLDTLRRQAADRIVQFEPIPLPDRFGEPVNIPQSISEQDVYFGPVKPTILPLPPRDPLEELKEKMERIEEHDQVIIQIGRDLVDQAVETVLNEKQDEVTQPIPLNFNLFDIIDYLFRTYRRRGYRMGYWIINDGGYISWYTVSSRNFSEQTALLQGGLEEYEEQRRNLILGDNPRGFFFNKILEEHNRIGAFFEKLISDNCDIPCWILDKLLKECQIYTEDTLLFCINEQLFRNKQCLRHTFDILEVEYSVKNLGRYMVGNKINTYNMREIANSIGREIIVHMIRNKGNKGKEDKHKYGDNLKNPIHIALYDNHFFPYFTLTREKDVIQNILLRIGIEGYNKRFLTNLTLIWLIDIQGLLETLPAEYYPYFNHKQPDSIDNLHFFDTKPIKYKEKRLLKRGTTLKQFDNKITDENLAIVYADIEAYPVGVHTEYSISYRFNMGEVLNIFSWADCTKIFLDGLAAKCEKTDFAGCIIYFHNLGYDGPFFQHKYGFMKELSKGTKIYGFRKNWSLGKNKYIFFFKDTLPFLPMKVAEMPKAFGLEGIKKNIYPYKLYDETLCKSHKIFIDINEVLPYIKEKERKEFISDGRETGFIKENRFFYKKYCIFYNNRDVEILSICFEKLVEGFARDFHGLDVHKMWSISSLAQQHIKRLGCLEGCSSIGGAAKEFITKCAYGGRCDSLRGKAYEINEEVIPIDFTQLYPVAIIILSYMGGFLKGIPKVFETRGELPLEYDAYFAEIEVFNIPVDLDWPNVKLGKGYYCSLDVKRWELFEGMKEGKHYRILRGYYYNKGRTAKIKKVMSDIIERRTRKKAAGDATNICEKNAGNGIYGKFGQKEYTKNKVWKTKKTSKSYQDKYHYRINVVHEGEKIDIIEEFKRQPEAMNEAHIYSEILAVSKIIDSIVFDECRKKEIKVFYHDTDCFFIKYKEYKSGKLDHIFTPESFADILCEYLNINDYDKKDMINLMKKTRAGTLHNDIEPKDALKEEEPRMSRVIIAGKKLYCGEYSYKTKEETKNKLKKACKGINWDSLLYHFPDPMSMFQGLVYKKIKPVIDAAADGAFCVQNTKDKRIKSRDSFPRTLKCEKELVII